jgi:hypothetical protein
MARFRMFLACLLLVAIPLQGLAAATMLFCGPSGTAQQAASAAHDLHVQHHGTAAGHDHAMHQHAGHDEATSQADQPTEGPNAADPGQKCSVCAACCHSVAITEAPNVPALSPAPQTISAEPPVAVHSRPSPVPDKPPRA